MSYELGRIVVYVGKRLIWRQILFRRLFGVFRVIALAWLGDLGVINIYLLAILQFSVVVMASRFFAPHKRQATEPPHVIEIELNQVVELICRLKNT